MSTLQYCVYILIWLKDNKFYIGLTTDLKQRLTDHFKGRSSATAPRRPFKFIYCEYFLSKNDAYRREKYLKTSTGKRMLKLLLKETFKEIWFLIIFLSDKNPCEQLYNFICKKDW